MPSRSTGADVAPASAESLLAAFLARREAGESPDLEELCAAHPVLAPEIRRLHDELARTGVLAAGVARGLRRDAEEARRGEVSDGESGVPLEGIPPRLRERRVPSDRYEIGEEIAKGGMGAILRARDPDLRRVLAMKVMRPDKLAKHARDPALAASFVRRFLEEAKVTAQLSHPGIVPVHELALDHEGRPYFTMALIAGRDLQEVIALARAGAESWTPTRVVDVLLKVCETLAYAHSRGVVHRDLKPANVRVGSFGEVYVMDWGLAKLASRKARRTALAAGAQDEGAPPLTVDRDDLEDGDPSSASLTLDGTVVGTPGYMSPEQARGEELDARSDVYAVGAMLYTLLSGRAPYHEAGVARSPAGIVLATRRDPPQPVTSLAPAAPVELVAICERAMARDPARRYPSTQEMADDLRAYLENRVVRAYETGAWAELRKWVRRNRGTAAALGGLVLAVVGGTALTSSVRAQAAAREQRDGQINLGLQDKHDLDGLTDPATLDDLWPALPEKLPRLRSWLARAEAIRSHTEDHRRVLASFLSAGGAGEEDSRLAGVFQELLAKSSDLDAKFETIAARTELAGAIEQMTLTGPEQHAAWEKAIESIASSERYGGFRIEPQLGLLPLREDPRSGLWEFWHVLSGEKPELDPDTDRWRIEEATGVVLVLIPGGEYVLGASEGDPYVRHFEDRKRDMPPQPVRLTPYFLSKYELTQAQWERADAENESRDLGPTDPVERVTWERASEILSRLALELPTEAQWEAAARGGTRTRFYTGDEPQSLFGHVVILPDLDGNDQPDRDSSGKILPQYGQDWRGRHEPVGGREPNPFGLHDVVGNVSEWCRDEATVDPSIPMRDGDGLREPGTDTVLRVLRGGNYASSWPAARHSHRFPWAKGNREPDTGLRPARALR